MLLACQMPCVHVASETGSKPHIVCKTKKGSYSCDDACLAWKSQKLCSHVLAVAEQKQCLEEFLTGYKRSKTTGNYTAVSTHSLPKNVGKKPGGSKRKGPSHYKKPEIETYVDPFSTASQPATSSFCEVPGMESVPPAYLTTSVLGRQVSQTSAQPQSYHASPPISVSVTQTCRQNSPPLSHQLCTPPIHSTASLTGNQICQLNFLPQNVSSPVQSSSIQLTQPSSLPQPASLSSQPFEVKLLTPAIKICAGCRKGYARSGDGKSCLPPPFDLCLVHKEQHLYYNVVNGKQQLSALSNVHYHANVSCPRIRFPQFNPQSVQVPQQLQAKLQPAHWLFLLQTFGVV